jgi:2-oxoglutarate ferredoxin oxidoreductase subunit beta
MALSAGATWIARGFSGDPSSLTRLLVDAIQHPGFALLHVLSPCQTFRPEQRQWKELVHAFADDVTDDPVEAAQRIQADDGMALGLIYSHPLPVWQPRNEATRSVADLEQEFRV